MTNAIGFHFASDWFSSNSYRAASWWSRPEIKATPSAHARVIGAAKSSWRAKDATAVASLRSTFLAALIANFWCFLTLSWFHRFSSWAYGTSRSTFGHVPCSTATQLGNRSPLPWAFCFNQCWRWLVMTNGPAATHFFRRACSSRQVTVVLVAASSFHRQQLDWARSSNPLQVSSSFRSPSCRRYFQVQRPWAARPKCCHSWAWCPSCLCWPCRFSTCIDRAAVCPLSSASALRASEYAHFLSVLWLDQSWPFQNWWFDPGI